MERDLLGQATPPDPLIDQLLTAARESQATILEWRAAMGPIEPRGDHNEPAEWQYQTAVCSQTFEDLSDQLGQLVIGREGRGQQRRQPPPSERSCWENILLPEEGDLLLQETFHQYIVRLREWKTEGGWIREKAQRRPAQAAAPPPPPQPAPRVNTPTPFKTTFDGTASKLAFFMNRAWSYIERHGNEFHDEAELVQFLGDNLEEEASEWFTQLNAEGAPELNNSSIHILDSSRAQEAEAEIKSIRQKGGPTKDLVLEFRRLTTNLKHWSQRLLVHYFQESLDEELLKNLPVPWFA
ncbi:Retrotransposon-derived protein PEG10, partial [Ophiophagus hannah]